MRSRRWLVEEVIPSRGDWSVVTRSACLRRRRCAGAGLGSFFGTTQLDRRILKDEGWNKHRKTADELAKKQGADFDRDYVKAMVEGHQNLAAKLESRLDVQSLTDWKTAAAGRAESKALPEPTAPCATCKSFPTRATPRSR